MSSQEFKSRFQTFIETNQALIDCYAKVKVDDYKKMSEQAREGLCAGPKEQIKEMMRNNELKMENLVDDRIYIMYKLWGEKKD